MTTRNFVTTNEFVPTLVVSDPNGRSTSNPDLAFETLLASERNFSNLLKRHAYERLNESGLAKSNPPFNTGSAGRLTSIVTSGTGGNSPQISRGYIRRSNLNSTDPTGGYRLYFMYNPESIQRNYTAYLEQAALDPFNTIYGANNLVAPPGILDFEFSLMFDRQTENANGSMPRGVLEDFDYFDLVVRGTVPGVQTNPIQDNGIMMINPRNITVVFGPQLSVQGRPYRASVQYQKFDHRMTPIRMVINLSMKVYYFGPIREDFSFASTESVDTFEATIPYDENLQYEVTYIDVAQATLTDSPNVTRGAGAARTISTGVGSVVVGPNADVRRRALEQALTLGEFQVPYTWGKRTDPPEGGFDCSGLVYWSYTKIGAVDAIGGPQAGYTRPMRDRAVEMGTIIAGDGAQSPFDANFVDSGYLQPGDLLLSQDKYADHIAFVKSVDIENKIVYSYESRGGGPHSDQYNYTQGGQWSLFDWYNYVIRPAGAGTDTVVNIGSTPFGSSL